MCKVGGEIEATVIESFSNKQHTGFLGHSYLGRWVNLGAGTSNSNLKNTYGTVRMEVGGHPLDTGMQFMGCVIGDFTRSAINTAIFTGKLIGCCSMLYGFVTTNVPSFVNYARSFGEITELSVRVMVQTQRRVFLRRGIEQQPWHVRLLEDMYELASAGRQLADRPVSL
jgi:glucose-1-phosphate thymidylyltransferase